MLSDLVRDRDLALVLEVHRADDRLDTVADVGRGGPIIEVELVVRVTGQLGGEQGGAHGRVVSGHLLEAGLPEVVGQQVGPAEVVGLQHVVALVDHVVGGVSTLDGCGDRLDPVLRAVRHHDPSVEAVLEEGASDPGVGVALEEATHGGDLGRGDGDRGPVRLLLEQLEACRSDGVCVEGELGGDAVQLEGDGEPCGGVTDQLELLHLAVGEAQGTIDGGLDVLGACAGAQCEADEEGRRFLHGGAKE